MFNGFYLKLLAKYLRSQSNSTDGWIYLTHDADDDPALNIYYGDFLNPTTGLDNAVVLTKVRNKKANNSRTFPKLHLSSVTSHAE